MGRQAFAGILALFLVRLACYALANGLDGHFAHHLCKWDCGWYIEIVGQGYQLAPKTDEAGTYGQANWAFFPLFPLLIHTLWRAAPVTSYLAAFIVANLALLFFVLVAIRYLPARRPGASPAALAAFLLAFPYGVYFSLPYTESLFALFASLSLLALAERRLMVAAWCSAVLSATRVPGVLLCPVIAVRALAPACIAWRAGSGKQALRLAADALLPIALAPLGLVLFMAYLYAHMGDALAFAHIQAGWGRVSASPFTTLLQGAGLRDWRFLFGRQTQSGLWDECAALAGLLLCARLAWLRFWPECWMLGASVMLALAAGLVSMERYVFANPIFLIFLFDWLWSSRRFRRCFPAVLGGCAALQLFFLHRWLQSYAFLM